MMDNLVQRTLRDFRLQRDSRSSVLFTFHSTIRVTKKEDKAEENESCSPEY